VLYREPKLLKGDTNALVRLMMAEISVLYREPKLLKAALVRSISGPRPDFSALP